MVKQNVSFVGTILFYTVILSGMALPPLAYIQVTTWYNYVMDGTDGTDCNGFADCGECDDCAFYDDYYDKQSISYYDSLDSYVDGDGYVDIVAIGNNEGNVGIWDNRDSVLSSGYAEHKGWFKKAFCYVQPDHYHCDGCSFRYCGDLRTDCTGCDGQ